MPTFKRDVTLVVEHHDLTAMLTDILCTWAPFSSLNVAYISEKAGQFHINLTPKKRQS